MSLPKTLCNKRFRVGKPLGKGTYGEVYSAIDTASGQPCALKLEPHQLSTPQLLYEAKVLKVLQSLHGVPTFFWSGADQGYNIVSMQLLGSSFEQLLNQCKGKFSLKTTLLVGDQMVQRLESVHGLNYIHRDIKPENFAVGLGSAGNFVYVFDFGLAKKFRDPITHQHIPYRENQGLIGTVRYASINSHMGMELSRRDDLESLLYMLIFFVTGSLPWQGTLPINRKEKYQRVLELKLNTSFEVLCKGLPPEFSTVFRYVRGLQFDSKPDYSYIRRVLRSCFGSQKLSPSPEYDWNYQPAPLLRVAEEPSTALLGEKSHKSESASRGSQTTQVSPGPYFKREVRERLRRMRSVGYAS